jgi:carbamoyltransferase
LARGRIVGRFCGRSEFGPRALGNRSILAAPGPASVKDLLNQRVKYREPFRPFAPSVVEGHCGEYFDDATPSPFMLRVYNTRPTHVERLGAITHVDGTARVQTVNQAQNAEYLALIQAYGQRTGTHCVLNTSFNIRGEPIVNTPQDALKCFFTTDMDDLYLGPFAIEKRRT